MSTPRADAYPPAASQATVQQLLELDEAALALTGELDLPRLLQRIVDAARDLTGARYGALGILRPDDSLEYFLTSGLDPAQGTRIGALPRGVGLLGVMSHDARPVRVDRIADDPRRAGFPPNHPRMESLIGMPIVHEGHSAGHLYLADKAAGGAWTDTDEWLVALLARHAAVAIANARLYRTVAEERAAAARARDEAEAGRRQLAVLLQNLPEGVVACDAAGTVTLMNPTGAALMGWELGRPLAERRAQVLHADGRPYAEEDLPLIRTLHEDRAFQEEYRLLPPPPDTVLRDILTSTAPLHDSRNHLTGAIGVYQDITALKAVERMKDDFFAMATHEFRTPLTSITLAAGLLQELLQPAGGPSARLADLLGDNAQRLRSLVDDLLDLGRLEQGRIHLLRQPLDLRDAVQHAVEQIDPLVARKGQRVRMHLPRHDCVVPADPARVEQVLVNLLSNATKYTPAGGNVDITFQRRAHEVVVVVQDDGPGVAADEQDRIFERFYRSRRQAGDGTVGTGLGLPIARMLVELHGGRLWFEDAPRRGSRFCCAWPAGAP